MVCPHATLPAMRAINLQIHVSRYEIQSEHTNPKVCGTAYCKLKMGMINLWGRGWTITSGQASQNSPWDEDNMLLAPSVELHGDIKLYKYDLCSFCTLIKLILILKEHCMTIIKTMINSLLGWPKPLVSSLTSYGKTQIDLLANPTESKHRKGSSIWNVI